MVFRTMEHHAPVANWLQMMHLKTMSTTNKQEITMINLLFNTTTRRKPQQENENPL
eukprot:m.67686 g.67686  ORF g.67686 m.67686 type:complete len:56 (-) comp11907_c0_seq4:168-335(-)